MGPPWGWALGLSHPHHPVIWGEGSEHLCFQARQAAPGRGGGGGTEPWAALSDGGRSLLGQSPGPGRGAEPGRGRLACRVVCARPPLWTAGPRPRHPLKVCNPGLCGAFCRAASSTHFLFPLDSQVPPTRLHLVSLSMSAPTGILSRWNLTGDMWPSASGLSPFVWYFQGPPTPWQVTVSFLSEAE